MRILHTADWHIGNFRSPVRDGVNLRTEDTKRCLDEVVKVARDGHPDYSLVSGDIFHVGRLWSDRCCEEIVTAFHYIRELAAVSRQVVVMRGTPNHDGAGQFNVLKEMFSASPNVHIVDTPQMLHFGNIDIAVLPGFDRGVFRAKFPGLSGGQENEVFTQELANIILGLKAQCAEGAASVLMAHYTVPGCNTESGQEMFLSQFEPIISQETLQAAGFDLVALGHIHRPQRIGGDSWYYSGAVNQLNFNDEGQERGFWVHEGPLPFGGWDSTFHNTPAREHITFDFTSTDVTAVNFGRTDEVAFNYWRYNGAVRDKIVRIRYSCSDEDNKAFKLNTALLEKALLNDGAFMVWDILPDKVDETVNREELAHTTDPEANLMRYLEEKQVPQDKAQELLLKARPVIAEAEACMPSAAHTGVFEPVEIAVKNYRNYEDETFNFENITFCTINGQNGAGKSSLFMDAILDCLYEQPREGIVKDGTGKAPWLREDEKVRSGSIMFTFRIGDKGYRVTRTRAKSGKGTLNLAEKINGGWEDRSKERYNDTQKEILDILGMDSLTFKSCALIMQDQYGLFLQAKPEERVEVLGTLLGLGVYQIMERAALDRAKANGAKARELKQEIEIHSHTVESYGKPDEELEACRASLEAYESKLSLMASERDRKKLLLAGQQEASQRREKLLASITALQGKKASIGQGKAAQQEILDRSTAFLSGRAEIEAKAAEHKALLARELELAGESALYSTKKAEVENLGRQALAEQGSVDAYKEKLRQKESELAGAQPTDQDAAIKEKAEAYARRKSDLEAMQAKAAAYQQAKAEYSAAAFRQNEVASKYTAERKSLEERKAVLEKKVSLLAESGCVDIGNAHCRFLQDAVEAKGQLAQMDAAFTAMSEREKADMGKCQSAVDAKRKAMEGVGHDADALAALEKECAELFPYVGKVEEINQREGRIALLEADIRHLQSNIGEAEKRLSTVKIRAVEAERERDQYAKAFEEHVKVMASIVDLEPWLEKEKQIPVAVEREATARARISELAAELTGIDAEIAEKQADADREMLAMTGMEGLAGEVARLDAEVDAIDSMVKSKQMEIGALQQKADQIAKLKKEIFALQEKQTEYAKEASDYDALRAAFSQGGIPHQIIRSIIPHLTATSNTILGQMTGGKMGIEFRLESLQKNGKEKASLDIFIAEYGKSVLPYLSKSGGEKVKSSLAVILSLAEAKSSSAGIQLGMLFIDEPPFLDHDGVDAYCDALETIRNRYPALKVMAITHDPAMKARFPQSLDVVKTENGSKVIY